MSKDSIFKTSLPQDPSPNSLHTESEEISASQSLFETIGQATNLSTSHQAYQQKLKHDTTSVPKPIALYNVILISPGASKFRAGQVLSILLSRSYVAVLDLFKSLPVTIASHIEAERAQEMKTLLEATGATVRIDPSPES